MKILFINQPLGNRGDESAHKALIRALLKNIPEVKIQVLFVGVPQNSIDQFAIDSQQVEYIHLLNRESTHNFIRNNKVAKFVFSRWKKMQYKRFYHVATSALQKENYNLWDLQPVVKQIQKYYHEADMIVCAPGGICMGGFQNWYHLFYLKLAQRMNKPLAYYGRSFGPFPTETTLNRQFKKLSLELLHYFTFNSIRDKKTEALAQELSIDYVPTLDSAFLDTPQAELPKEIVRLNGAPYMVFVPNLLTWHYAYKDVDKKTILSFYNQLADSIVEKYPDYHLVMLPQTFNSAESNDILLFQEIANIRKDTRIVVMPDCYSSDIQQRIIHDAKFVVGARYHSIVFSINQAVPFIALSYEHKITGLLQTLGKENCMIDITEIFKSEDTIQHAVSTFKQMLPELKADVTAQIEAKERTYECFKQFIKRNNLA